jgi:serine/threonine protein kinase
MNSNVTYYTTFVLRYIFLWEKFMQDGIRREVQTMTLIDHPNVLQAHCSFTAGHSLWVVMPYMAGGSCLHIMKSGHSEGFEEPVIATLLREVLKALVYLHAHGHIHRDVKVTYWTCLSHSSNDFLCLFLQDSTIYSVIVSTINCGLLMQFFIRYMKIVLKTKSS